MSKILTIILILMGAFLLSKTFKNTKMQIDQESSMSGQAKELKENQAQAVFGLGCFWCSEAIFQRLKGVLSVESGYMGGDSENSTYKEVSTGNTGHAEVIRVIYNPKEISYEALLSVFWLAHDPTTLNSQGADVGTQYRSIIFYFDNQQREIALASKKQVVSKFHKPIVTEIKSASNFHLAEINHQDYYDNNRKAPYCRFVIDPKLKKLGLE